MVCPACQAENDDSAEICFDCRAVLISAVTRGTVISSRYEVLTTLGRGGMGVVYQATDRVLEETVAIKLLRSDVAKDTEMARRFRSEIKLARKVTHRNVCRIHEYGEDGPLRFISMEFVEGTDLKRVLRDKGPFPPDEAFETAIQAAQGLEAIHEVGIIHRDLKTTNIMRDRRGVVRLMDFGIAKQTGAEGTGATATGQIVGTPEYMSPEQARGLKADLRSDVYSLGVVVYELFTGRVPFKGETPVATLFMHVQDAPPLEGPSTHRLPPDLVPVLRLALAKDPAQRYPGAREMCDALRQARAAWQQAGATVVPGGTAIVDSARPTTPVPMGTPPPTATVRASARASDAPTEVATRILETTEKPRPPARAPRVSPPRPVPPPPSRAPQVAMGASVIAVAAVMAVLWLRSREAVPPPAPLAPAALGVPSTLASPPPATDTIEPSRAPEPLPSPAATTAAVVPPARGASPKRAVATERAPSPRPTPVPSVAIAPTPFPTPPPTTAAPAPPVTAPPATVPAALPVTVEERGFLQVVVVPYAEATIDGTAMGRVSSSKVPLKAGSHTVVLSHPEYQPLQRKVTVVPGETVRLIIDLSEEAIRKKR